MRPPTREDEPNQDLVDFGEVVRRWRSHSGMSQRRLAMKAGINQSSVSRLEHGRLPGFQLYRAVALLKIIGLMPPRRHAADPARDALSQEVCQ